MSTAPPRATGGPSTAGGAGAPEPRDRPRATGRRRRAGRRTPRPRPGGSPPGLRRSDRPVHRPREPAAPWQSRRRPGSPRRRPCWTRGRRPARRCCCARCWRPRGCATSDARRRCVPAGRRYGWCRRPSRRRGSGPGR
ncbi:hypothetical protein DMP17_18610 [Pseudonocardia sp. TMWB2A]